MRRCTFSHHWRWLMATVLCMLMPSGPLLPAVAASQLAADRYADVRPELLDDVTTAVDDDLSSYIIDATLDDVAGTIAGTMDVTFLNDSGTPLNEVYFRLYPNIDYYGEGDLAISDVTVDGSPAPATFEVDNSALRVELPAPLSPDEAVSIALSFTTTVPMNSAGSYGIFSREASSGTWILADWHPVLAVFEPDHGWRIDPATPAGDPTYAASAFYDVTITAPNTLTVVTTGTAIETSETQADGTRTARYIAGPAREFTLVVDNDYVVTSEQIDGVTVSVYTEPEVALELAQQTLDITARSLQVFSELFGPYPYTELDVVETRLDGALAVSWSGIIFIDGPSMLNRMAVDDPLGLETIIAHEVSHLWWGGTVGSNSNDHTFINEGLATLSSIVYLERTAGEETAAIAREQWILRPARWLVQHGDVVADQPAAGQDESVRSAAVYGKGSLGFAAVRREIGDEAFFAALSAYATEHQFEIADPGLLKAAFATAAGRSLDDLWAHWFDETAMTLDEVESFAQ